MVTCMFTVRPSYFIHRTCSCPKVHKLAPFKAPSIHNIWSYGSFPKIEGPQYRLQNNVTVHPKDSPNLGKCTRNIMYIGGASDRGRRTQIRYLQGKKGISIPSLDLRTIGTTIGGS